MSELRNLHHVKAVFDTSTTDSAGVSNKTITTHGLGVYLPKNAVITRAFYDVTTTFADGVADAATIALNALSAGDLVVAIAIADVSAVWTAGIHSTLAGSPALGSDYQTADACTAIIYGARIAASMIKETSTTEISATVGGVVLAAGKLNLFIEYFISS